MAFLVPRGPLFQEYAMLAAIFTSNEKFWIHSVYNVSTTVTKMLTNCSSLLLSLLPLNAKLEAIHNLLLPLRPVLCRNWHIASWSAAHWISAHRIYFFYSTSIRWWTIILEDPRLIQWRWSLSTEAQWAACSPHLLLSDSSKAHTLFHRSLSGLPAAHTFFCVIPQSPHLISPCLWVISQILHLISPFSQWNAIGPGFSQKNLVYIRIQSKKNCLRRNLFQKLCLRRNFFIKNLETVCLRLSVLLSKIGTRTGASLSSIRKDRN